MAAGLAFVTDEATDVKNVGPALSLNYIPCEGILFCHSCFSSEGFHVREAFIYVLAEFVR